MFLTRPLRNKPPCPVADKFSKFDLFEGLPSIAAALSGGADSTALTHMLCDWAKGRNVTIHALIVDHGLRPESAGEAEKTFAQAKTWPNCTPVILKWQGDKPETGLMAAARDARYTLIQDYCHTHAIPALTTGHHADDQVETFFIRLSKGSGLDGLSAMQPTKQLGDDLVLVRPLLDLTHQDLMTYCRDHALEWVEDAGNQNMDFERNRLRNFLAEEGLDHTRITTLMQRLNRARQALDMLCDHVMEDALLEGESHGYDWAYLSPYGMEILTRIIIRAIMDITGQSRHKLRLARIEALCDQMLRDGHMKTHSLHHCLITLNNERMMIRPEA